MTGKNKRGFTLVEAVLVAVVVAVLMAFLIPVLREREQRRLEALADAEPWEVFEFRAAPAQESFPQGEDIVVQCEIVNSTNYPLAVPKRLREFFLTFGDTDYVVGKKVWLSPVIPEAPIAPGEPVSFDLNFRVDGIGEAELRVVYWSGESPFTTIGAVTKLGPTLQNQSDALGILPSGVKRFQSNRIQFFVEAGDGYGAPSTFDEIVADSVWLESSVSTPCPFRYAVGGLGA